MRLLGRDEVRRIPTEDETRRAAREQERRDKRIRIAMRSGWTEIPRSDLRFGRFEIEDTRSGLRYKPMLGEVGEGGASPVSAFYVDESGAAQFLERA